MTKAEIVNAISEETGLTRPVVLQAVEGFMKAVKGSLAAGEEVTLRGFGTFAAKMMSGRVVRDIGRGESFVMADTLRVKFKPSKEMIGQMNEK